MFKLCWEQRALATELLIPVGIIDPISECRLHRQGAEVRAGPTEVRNGYQGNPAPELFDVSLNCKAETQRTGCPATTLIHAECAKAMRLSQQVTTRCPPTARAPMDRALGRSTR